MKSRSGELLRGFTVRNRLHRLPSPFLNPSAESPSDMWRENVYRTHRNKVKQLKQSGHASGTQPKQRTKAYKEHATRSSFFLYVTPRYKHYSSQEQASGRSQDFWIDIDMLRPAAYNPRTHNEAQEEQLTEHR